MSEGNTFDVRRMLSREGLVSMHCFLRFEGRIVDLTWPHPVPTGQTEFFYEQIVTPGMRGYGFFSPLNLFFMLFRGVAQEVSFTCV